jgi:hypothetical protein
MGAHTETLESYLDAAVEAAKRAGQIILSNFYVTKAVEHKGKVRIHRHPSLLVLLFFSKS